MNGSTLKNLRESLGLTQTELAHKLGYKNYHTIYWWESDKKPIPEYIEPQLIALQKISQDICQRDQYYYGKKGESNDKQD